MEDGKLLVEMLASENDKILSLGEELRKITIFYYLGIAIFFVVLIVVFGPDNFDVFWIFGIIILLLIARIIYIYSL